MVVDSLFTLAYCIKRKRTEQNTVVTARRILKSFPESFAPVVTTCPGRPPVPRLGGGPPRPLGAPSCDPEIQPED
ncbi:hypothetical protein EYF80_043149 [Liparis tanakae]|uniref:Uncharacterized protein n=1 Tax=Liparis tanakae TaxID=230148 RepID=A0A4Z2G0J5_9TELE|nr:hypothetical protein EYF80_043149 [Liparis tanakae]